MTWRQSMELAERMLASDRIPPSEQIISLIKRVNPTRLHLPEELIEKGYQVKDRLQNLLLEQYGESFYLCSHPLTPDVVLIKHCHLPDIDACHAHLDRLSAQALGNVKEAPAPLRQKTPRHAVTGSKEPAPGPATPAEHLKKAQRLLDAYEYDAAKDTLGALRIARPEDLPFLLKGVAMLLEEIGTYDTAIELLLAQPKQILKEKKVREILALTYRHNKMFPEARAIFEAAAPGELGKEALYAYAEIAFSDGNYALAYLLLEKGDEKEGFRATYAELRREIERAMKAEAEPYLKRAHEAFRRDEIQEARRLAKEALEHYPKFTEAGQMVRAIDDTALDRERAALWEEFAAGKVSHARLELLERLLELEQYDAEKVKTLIEAERFLLKRTEAVQRIGKLPDLVREQRWQEAFDVLWWLLRHEMGGEYATAFTHSPFFQVLRNQRLQKLADHKAKQTWLAYLRVMTTDVADPLQLVSELKPYFKGYPEFDARCREVIEMDLARARKRASYLLAALHGEKCTMPEAERISAMLRKLPSHMPLEERARYQECAEKRVRELKGRIDQSILLDAYRESLTVGDRAAAERTRGKVAIRESLEVIEEELRLDFRVIAEPVPVSVSSDLAVDLASEEGTLPYIGATSQEVILQESDVSILLVNLREMEATRYSSSHFKGLSYLDALPAQGIYLFGCGNLIVKVKLCRSEPRILSIFNMCDRFSLKEEEAVWGLLMSVERDGEYFSHSGVHRDNAYHAIKVTRQDIFNRHTKNIYHVTRDTSPPGWYRLSETSDKFVCFHGESAVFLDRSLSGQRLSNVMEVLSVNSRNQHVYGRTATHFFVYDVKSKKYLEFAPCAGFFGPAYGICTRTKTVLHRVERSKFFLYRYSRYEMSDATAKILCTTAPSTYYYYNYDRSRSVLRLRDISLELDNFANWEWFSEKATKLDIPPFSSARSVSGPALAPLYTPPQMSHSISGQLGADVLKPAPVLNLEQYSLSSIGEISLTGGPGGKGR